MIDEPLISPNDMAGSDNNTRDIETGTFHPPQQRTGVLGWVAAATCLYAFAMSSGVVGVGYAMGAQGIVFGAALAAILVAATVIGSKMLTSIWLHQKAHRPTKLMQSVPSVTLAQIGIASLGETGGIFCVMGQYGNLFLYMPIAMTLCADALRDIFPHMFSCEMYYVFVCGGICLLSTQARTMGNTAVISATATVFIFVIAAIQIFVSYDSSNPDKQPVSLFFGNDEPKDTNRIVRGTLGASMALWSYAPAFVLTEVLNDMSEPRDMHRALSWSGGAVVATIVIVGSLVSWNWGWQLQNPIMITGVWEQKVSGSGPAVVSSVLLFICSVVSYALDTIPLAQACMRSWNASFYERYARSALAAGDGSSNNEGSEVGGGSSDNNNNNNGNSNTSSRKNQWSAQAIFENFLVTLPPWFVALIVAVFVPNLFDLLAFVTALTVPIMCQIYPSVCFYYYFIANRAGAGTERGGAEQVDRKRDPAEVIGIPQAPRSVTRMEKVQCLCCFVIGVGGFCFCMVGAIGQVLSPELRGETQIGCASWGL